MGVEEEYRKRLGARQAEFVGLEKQFLTLSNLRLVAGLLLVVVAWLAFGQQWISPWWMTIPAAIFTALLIYHDSVVTRRRNAARAVNFYQNGLERIEDRWQGKGRGCDHFNMPEHIYASDLDLFGKGSLFELLNTARTGAGEQMLARWLQAPASTEVAKARQAGVEELRPKLDLRESMALIGEEVRAGLHPEMLLKWAAATPAPFAPWIRPVAALLATALVSSLVLYMSGILRLTPFLILLMIDLGWMVFYWQRIGYVLAAMQTPSKDLNLFSSILKRIEQEQFSAPYLQSSVSRLRSGDLPASRCIAALHRFVVRLDWTKNQIFAPIAMILLWHLQVAISIEQWRETHGQHIAEWIEAAGILEAMLALSGYAYEHPQDPFPNLDHAEAGFEAEDLGHPLIAKSKVVRNSVQLGGKTRLLIVSGSNMSGKSTLLRAIGLNTVLAWAGAPVRAARFAISPLQVGASIRVQDSLQDGKSRFYAEITRLRQITGCSGQQPPLLFLIDEMLSGTNSHDRRIGAQAILLSLVNAGAIGFVTTHDLALAEMGDDFGGRAVNVHFEDTLEDGKLTFDYHLRQGIVKRSNALELMRGLGLNV